MLFPVYFVLYVAETRTWVGDVTKACMVPSAWAEMNVPGFKLPSLDPFRCWMEMYQSRLKSTESP